MNTQTKTKSTKMKQWEIAYEFLLKNIQSGEYPVGTSIPSIPKLSDDLNFSRCVVQRAIEELEKNGLIIRRHGAGCYVLPPKGIFLNEDQEGANQHLRDALAACQNSGMTKRQIDYLVNSHLAQTE